MHQKRIECIKFELANQNNPQLKHEQGVLQSIHEEQIKEGFPKVHAYEKDSKSYCYMIIEF